MKLLSLYIILLVIITKTSAGPVAGYACANCLAVNCAVAAGECYPLFVNPPAWVMCMAANASWKAYFLCVPVCLATWLPVP